MPQVLLNVDLQRSSTIKSIQPYFGNGIQNIKSKLLKLSLILCVFSFASFFSQEIQAQNSGSYTFTAPNATPPNVPTSFTFTYTVTSGVINITFSPSLPLSLVPQIRMGTGPFTFIGMTSSGSLSYTATLTTPTTPFIFYMAYSGGLYESPGLITPLPITLTDFSTSKNGDRSALLTWKTSTEINSDYFGIERSTDGITWDHITQVNAAGNSYTDLSYSYVDADFPANRTANKIFYYRLKLTDLDGSFEYSDIRGINISSNLNVISVYPNPTIDRINIDLSGIDTQAKDVEVEIYDQKGTEIMTKTIIGSGIELIDVNQLPSATYFIVLKQGSETIHQSSIVKVN